MCYRIGESTGVFSSVGNTLITVSATTTATYTYNTLATCTYSNNLNTQCCGTATAIEIGSSVKTIPSKAFYGCSTVISVDFAGAGAVTSIGGDAFQGTSITSLDMSGLTNLTYIGLPKGVSSWKWKYYCTFRNMAKLVSVNLAGTVTEIGGGSFQNNDALTNIDFSNAKNLLKIGPSAFESCDALESVDMSGATKLVMIGEKAFYSSTKTSSKLATVKLSSSIATIGKSAFTSKSSSSLTPTGVDFNGCECGAVTKSAGMTKPFPWACPNIPSFLPTQSTFCVAGVPCTFNFTFDSLIDTPTTRPHIKLVAPGTACATGDTNALPGSLSQVVSKAATHGLVTLNVVAPVINAGMCYRIGLSTGVFSSVGNTLITVRATATATYTYNTFATCTYATNLNTQCCGSATAIDIGSAVKTIASKAFYGCSTVTSVDLAAAALLLSIGSEAFYGTSIVSLDFSPLVNLSTVGDNAFKGMSKLVLVNVGATL
jgi:hypothetical protein